MEPSSIVKGSHLRKILRHGSLYMVGNLLVASGSALLLPLYTRWLAPAEYAIFSNLMAVVAIAGIVISLFVDYAYARFYFDVCRDPAKLRRLFSTIFLFSLAWGGLAAVGVFFVIRAYVSSLLNVAWYPFILLACMIPFVNRLNLLAAAHFRVQHRSSTVAGARVLGFVVGTIVSVVLLLRGGMGPAALLWGALAGGSVVTLLYFGLLRRDGLIAWEFSFTYLKDVLIFSVGLLPTVSCAWLSGWSDKLLITWFGCLADSGVYSVAFEIGRLMNIFVMSLFAVYTPMIYAMLKENAEENLPRIRQFQSCFFHVLVGLAFFISIFSPEVFHFFVSERYHGGIGVVPVIAFAFVFAGVRRLYVNIAYYHKLTLLISLGGIIEAVMSFGLNIALIPLYGGRAAAWAKLLSLVVVSAYFYFVSTRREPLRIDWRALGVTMFILAACAGAAGLCVYVLNLSFWPLLAAKVGIAGLAVAMTWRSRFGDDLRRTLFKRRPDGDDADDGTLDAQSPSISGGNDV